MKTVYLILYLWHASGRSDYSGGSGGPAFQIVSMPSISACEIVGTAAKKLADEQAPELIQSRAGDWTQHRFTGKPTAYRCVEVASK